MKKFLTVAGAALVLSFSAVAAHAATLFSGEVTNVTANTNDPGLVIHTGNYNTFNVPLEVGTPSAQVGLFSIWTDEKSIDLDDIFAKDIAVQILFTAPAGPWAGGPIGGDTFGINGIIKQGGVVVWDAPEIYTFGNGGQLKVTLQDTTFNWGWFGANPGANLGAAVSGSFELIQLPSAVPEPATWAMMITGFGLAGTAIRRRRTTFAVAA